MTRRYRLQSHDDALTSSGMRIGWRHRLQCRHTAPPRPGLDFKSLPLRICSPFCCTNIYLATMQLPCNPEFQCMRFVTTSNTRRKGDGGRGDGVPNKANYRHVIPTVAVFGGRTPDTGRANSACDWRNHVVFGVLMPHGHCSRRTIVPCDGICVRKRIWNRVESHRARTV